MKFQIKGLTEDRIKSFFRELKDVGVSEFSLEKKDGEIIVSVSSEEWIGSYKTTGLKEIPTTKQGFTKILKQEIEDQSFDEIFFEVECIEL